MERDTGSDDVRRGRGRGFSRGRGERSTFGRGEASNPFGDPREQSWSWDTHRGFGDGPRGREWWGTAEDSRGGPFAERGRGRGSGFGRGFGWGIEREEGGRTFEHARGRQNWQSPGWVWGQDVPAEAPGWGWGHGNPADALARRRRELARTSGERSFTYPSSEPPPAPELNTLQTQTNRQGLPGMFPFSRHALSNLPMPGVPSPSAAAPTSPPPPPPSTSLPAASVSQSLRDDSTTPNGNVYQVNINVSLDLSPLSNLLKRK